MDENLRRKLGFRKGLLILTVYLPVLVTWSKAFVLYGSLSSVLCSLLHNYKVHTRSGLPELLLIKRKGNVEDYITLTAKPNLKLQAFGNFIVLLLVKYS